MLKNYFILIIVFNLSNLYAQKSRVELKANCAVRSIINGYKPIEINDKNKIPKLIIDEIELLIENKMGIKLMKIVNFTVGYQYDIKLLKNEHSKIINDYKWEIPKYIISYAFFDLKSGISYCMSFRVSKNDKLLSEHVPKINEEYLSSDFISKSEALKIIMQTKKKRKLKKINFEISKLTFNSQSGIFEWSFGLINKVSIEAIANGGIRFWNYNNGTTTF